MSIVLSRQTTEFPLYLHHGSEPPRLVTTKEEAAKFERDGWSRSYIAQPFPKTKYRAKGIYPDGHSRAGEIILDIKHVDTAEDEQKLGDGWYDKPDDVPMPVVDTAAKIAALKAALAELDPTSLDSDGKKKR